MLQQFGNLMSAISLLKDAFKIAFKEKNQSDKRGFQRKVVGFQFLLLELFENAENIFDSISKSDHSKKPCEEIQSIQFLTYEQSHTINKLFQLIEDEEIYHVMELLKPNLKRVVLNQLHSKRARIGLVLGLDNLEKNEIQELYSEEYHQKGVAIINSLRVCSEEIAALIRENMKFEDLIYLNLKA